MLTLPYRMYKLGMGYMMWCDKCHSIVSGGFGYTEHDEKHGLENRFICGECANAQHNKGKNRSHLSQAAGMDANRKEST